MTTPRSRALVLMIVLGLFVFAIVDMLLAMLWIEHRQGVLTSREYAQLHKQIAENPNDAALKDRIRELDVQLRSAHETRRWRFEWARWLILAGLVAWIGAARRYFALSPPKAGPIEAAPSWLSRSAQRFQRGRRARILGVAATGLLAAAALLALAMPGETLPGENWRERLAEQRARDQAAAPQSVASRYQGVWPCFRGPGNIGVAGGGDWPTTWSVATAHNVRWSVDVPLAGKSSPAVWREQIFLTAADANQQRVLCFSRDDGKLLWNALVAAPAAAARGLEPFQDTGYAASTPATDGRGVYAVFPTGIVAAFDMKGRPLWQKDLGLPDSMYSFASSPIVCDDLLLLQFDQGAEAQAMLSELLAFDVATGDLRYGVPRDVPNSWSSPAIIQTDSGRAMVTTANPWVIAYEPLGGAELWRASGLSGDIAPSPAYADGVVYATNDGAYLLAIETGGSGDVTESHVRWRGMEGVPDTCSPVAGNGYVLQVAAGGGLTCFAAESGELKWSEYLPSGAAASPILAGDLVYLACDDGVTRIFPLGDTFALADKGEIGEPIYATPAFVDNEIVIRGKRRLYCIGKAP